MTKPEEGEGGPLPPAPPPDPVVDQSELIEKLRKQILGNEKEIKDQRYTIQATWLFSGPLELCLLLFLVHSSAFEGGKGPKRAAEDLEEEVRKLQESLAALGAPTPASPVRRRQVPGHKEVQTEAWSPPVIKEQVIVEVERRVEVAPKAEPVKVKKEKVVAVEVAESSSDEAPKEEKAGKTCRSGLDELGVSSWWSYSF